MKKIAIGTLKGGVGKTQMVFNISAILAEKGFKVLVFDNDPQGNTTNDMGVSKNAEGFKSASGIYENNVKAEDIIIKSPIPELPTLDLICGALDMTASEMRIISYAGREKILSKWFDNNKDYLDQYDYVLFDTNPSFSVINQNAFLVSDSIILVTNVGANGLEGAGYFIDLWLDILSRLDLENNIKGLVVNQFRANTSESRDFIEYLKEHEIYKQILLDTIIPLNVRLSESETSCLPINLYDRNSTGGQAYLRLVDELMKKEIV